MVIDKLTGLPSPRARRAIIIAAITLAACLAAVAVVVHRSNPGPNSLPVAIQAVEPIAGSTVLAQSSVVVDLAVGYTAEIDINGEPIPEEQLARADALNLIRYSPAPGKVLERLATRQNCVRVHYWLIAQGPESKTTYTWCFDAN